MAGLGIEFVFFLVGPEHRTEARGGGGEELAVIVQSLNVVG